LTFTDEKCFHILLLLSLQITCYSYWLIEYQTGTFWLTDRDAGTKPLNQDCPG